MKRIGSMAVAIGMMMGIAAETALRPGHGRPFQPARSKPLTWVPKGCQVWVFGGQEVVARNEANARKKAVRRGLIAE